MNTVPLVVVPPGSDPVLEALRVVEAQVHEAGWDQGTRLLWLVTEARGLLGILEPPLPAALAAVHPEMLLNTMCRTWRGWPDSRRQVVGLALVFEVWSIVTPIPLELEGRIRDQPGRRESRVAIAAMANGTTRVLMRDRNHAPEQADPDEWAGDGGVVPAALRRFLQVALRNQRPV